MAETSFCVTFLFFIITTWTTLEVTSYPTDVIPQTRIIEGYPAEQNQFPFQVLLEARGTLGIGHCGGSIISDRWILTAGHCVYSFTTMKMQFGSIYLKNMTLTLKSTNFFEHPKYNDLTLENDIALIKLPESVIFNENIQPINLISKDQAGQDLSGRGAIISGFGYTSDTTSDYSDYLMYTFVGIITNKQCQEEFKDIQDFHLCASGAKNVESTCQGDSGGPLFLKEDNESYTQIGISSFVSKEGCTKGLPSGYTRIGYYLDWIHESMTK